MWDFNDAVFFPSRWKIVLYMKAKHVLSSTSQHIVGETQLIALWFHVLENWDIVFLPISSESMFLINNISNRMMIMLILCALCSIVYSEKDLIKWKPFWATMLMGTSMEPFECKLVIHF